MEQIESRTEQFEQHRSRLRAVAYRMLGSLADAEDAVQEAWLRLHRTDAEEIDNLGAWLTTVVARISLNVLRSRTRHPEESLDVRVPDPLIEPVDGTDPEHEALLSDSVGLALMVVLETLTPAERLAFVLHDTFGVPFEEIGVMMERSPAAARQLASRGRHKVRGGASVPDADPARQRAVVDAFFAAARDGDLEGLIAVLHPDAVLRADGGTRLRHQTRVLHGARAIAAEAVTFSQLVPLLRPVLINGTAGVVVATERQALSAMAFTVTDGVVVAIDVLADPDRLPDLV